METKYYRIRLTNKGLMYTINIVRPLNIADEDAIYILHPYKLAQGEAAIMIVGGVYRVVGHVEDFVDGTRWCTSLPSTLYLSVTEATQLEKLMCIGGKMKTITLTAELDRLPEKS